MCTMYLSVELQVAVNLYYLAGTSAEYRTIGNLFGIAKITVCKCVQRVCSAIEDKLLSTCTYVKIPEGEALNEVIEGYKKFGFPSGGAIDGTHITGARRLDNFFFFFFFFFFFCIFTRLGTLTICSYHYFTLKTFSINPQSTLVYGLLYRQGRKHGVLV